MTHPNGSEATSGRRPLVWAGALVALVVVVSLTWVTGGLAAKPHGIPVVGVGRTVDQGLFAVQVLDARTGRMRMHRFDPEKNLLVVRMRVTDQGDRSFGIPSFLGGMTAEPRPGKYADPDIMGSEGDVQGHDTSTIHPRLPVVVQVRWPLPDGTSPRSVTLAFRTWNYGQGFTDDTFYWSVTKQSPITAKVSLPVRTGATS